MKQMLKLAAISVALNREFRRRLCSEHADSETGRCREKRLQTPTVGKNAPASTENSKEGHKDANPESRLNDNPPPQERVGAPNTAPK